MNAPAWKRQDGESWRDWDRRMSADKAAEYERKRHEQPMPLDPLYSGSIDFVHSLSVGTFDCDGNAKGSGWW